MDSGFVIYGWWDEGFSAEIPLVVGKDVVAEVDEPPKFCIGRRVLRRMVLRSRHSQWGGSRV